MRVCVIAFLAISGNKYCRGNTFSCFLGFNIFWGFSALQTSAWIGAMATLFSVSWTYTYFMGSLLSIPLHRLELISFLATPGNKCHLASLFTPQPLRAVGVLFSPMVSGWAGVRAGGWAGGGKRVCPGCISETVRCRKLMLGRDIG